MNNLNLGPAFLNRQTVEELCFNMNKKLHSPVADLSVNKNWFDLSIILHKCQLLLIITSKNTESFLNIYNLKTNSMHCSVSLGNSSITNVQVSYCETVVCLHGKRFINFYKVKDILTKANQLKPFSNIKIDFDFKHLTFHPYSWAYLGILVPNKNNAFEFKLIKLEERQADFQLVEYLDFKVPDADLVDFEFVNCDTGVSLALGWEIFTLVLMSSDGRLFAKLPVLPESFSVDQKLLVDFEYTLTKSSKEGQHEDTLNAKLASQLLTQIAKSEVKQEEFSSSFKLNKYLKDFQEKNRSSYSVSEICNPSIHMLNSGNRFERMMIINYKPMTVIRFNRSNNIFDIVVMLDELVPSRNSHTKIESTVTDQFSLNQYQNIEFISLKKFGAIYSIILSLNDINDKTKKRTHFIEILIDSLTLQIDVNTLLVESEPNKPFALFKMNPFMIFYLYVFEHKSIYVDEIPYSSYCSLVSSKSLFLLNNGHEDQLSIENNNVLLELQSDMQDQFQSLSTELHIADLSKIKYTYPNRIDTEKIIGDSTEFFNDLDASVRTFTNCSDLIENGLFLLGQFKFSVLNTKELFDRYELDLKESKRKLEERINDIERTKDDITKKERKLSSKIKVIMEKLETLNARKSNIILDSELYKSLEQKLNELQGKVSELESIKKRASKENSSKILSGLNYNIESIHLEKVKNILDRVISFKQKNYEIVENLSKEVLSFKRT